MKQIYINNVTTNNIKTATKLKLQIDAHYYDTDIDTIFKYVGELKNEHTYKHKFVTTKGQEINMSNYEVMNLQKVRSLN